MKALVIGATGGIGSAIARLLASRATTLWLSGRNTEKLAELARQLNAHAFPAELSDEEQVRQLMTTVGALDLLVYAAGAVVRVNLREMSLAEWERVMAANLTGAFFVLKHAQWNSPAQAIFLGVYLDFVRVNGLSVYAASKAALEMMLAVARREMRQSGVRLTLVRLPEVATNLWSVFGGPPKRAFSPDEVAQRIIEGALVEPPPEVLEIARRQ
jgi:cyclic-di-GMP-binding biofilm dispersal mediator protein